MTGRQANHALREWSIQPSDACSAISRVSRNSNNNDNNIVATSSPTLIHPPTSPFPISRSLPRHALACLLYFCVLQSGCFRSGDEPSSDVISRLSKAYKEDERIQIPRSFPFVTPQKRAIPARHRPLEMGLVDVQLSVSSRLLFPHLIHPRLRLS